MSLLPTSLAAGETYASVDDILTCSDLAEATIRVPGWKKGGRALVIRVRAPSLEQRELIVLAYYQDVPDSGGIHAGKVRRFG